MVVLEDFGVAGVTGRRPAALAMNSAECRVCGIAAGFNSIKLPCHYASANVSTRVMVDDPRLSHPTIWSLLTFHPFKYTSWKHKGFINTTQNCLLHELVVGNAIISGRYDRLQNSVNRYLPDPTTQCQYSTTKSKQMRMGTNISETVRRKLSLGARILQKGGLEKVFKQFFSVKEGERLLKASQCYLSTTSGPLAGILFISTEKVAFCSERSMKVFTQKGQTCRIRYKVVIPVKRIKCVNQSENVQKPKQKYIEIVTEDNFDFWFMGVLNYQRTFRYLEQAVNFSSLDE